MWCNGLRQRGATVPGAGAGQDRKGSRSDVVQVDRPLRPCDLQCDGLRGTRKSGEIRRLESLQANEGHHGGRRYRPGSGPCRMREHPRKHRFAAGVRLRGTAGGSQRLPELALSAGGDRDQIDRGPQRHELRDRHRQAHRLRNLRRALGRTQVSRRAGRTQSHSIQVEGHAAQGDHRRHGFRGTERQPAPADRRLPDPEALRRRYRCRGRRSAVGRGPSRPESCSFSDRRNR